MNIRLKIMELEQVKTDLEENGYTKQEALQMIQAAAICQLSDCSDKNYNNQSYIRIGGGVATYEQ